MPASLPTDFAPPEPEGGTSSRWRNRIIGTAEFPPEQLLANAVAIEEWRPVVGHEGDYEISNLGRVRNVGSGRGRTRGRIRRLANHPCGYLAVGLYGHHGPTRPDQYLVHRLVAAAFIGPCPSGREVNHRDGVKTNNNAANLEYMTRSENLLHASATGLGLRGELNSQARLTESDVRSVRSMYASGMGYKRVARSFGVTWEAIRQIIKGKTWSYLA